MTELTCLTVAVRFSAEAACSVLETEVDASFTSLRLGVELLLRLVKSTHLLSAPVNFVFEHEIVPDSDFDDDESLRTLSDSTDGANDKSYLPSAPMR